MVFRNAYLGGETLKKSKEVISCSEQLDGGGGAVAGRGCRGLGRWHHSLASVHMIQLTRLYTYVCIFISCVFYFIVRNFKEYVNLKNQSETSRHEKMQLLKQSVGPLPLRLPFLNHSVQSRWVGLKACRVRWSSGGPTPKALIEAGSWHVLLFLLLSLLQLLQRRGWETGHGLPLYPESHRDLTNDSNRIGGFTHFVSTASCFKCKTHSIYFLPWGFQCPR